MSQDSLKNRRLLVVEDDPVSLAGVARILDKLGAQEVLTATDGGTAAKMLVSSPRQVDGIITDLNMRPVNGLELLKVIRIGYRDIPRDTTVIMFTALRDMGLMHAALSLDVNGFVLKPVDPRRLREVTVAGLAASGFLREPEDYKLVPTPTKTLMAELESEIGTAPDPEATLSAANILIAAERHGPGRVRKVRLSNACIGHELARDVVDGSGKVLVRDSEVLNENSVRLLQELAEIDHGIDDMIWIRVWAEQGQESEWEALRETE